MADSSVSINDSGGVARAVDAQTVGTDFQQTVTIGDGANAGRVAAVDSSGRLATQDSDTRATATLTAVDAVIGGTTIGSGPSNAVPTAGSTVSVTVTGQGIVGVGLVGGTGAGGICFEGQLPGSAYWVSLKASIPGTITLPALFYASNSGYFRVDASGYSAIRVRCYTAYTVYPTVYLSAVPTGSVVQSIEPLPLGPAGITTDALSTAQTTLPVQGINYLFNGTTFERQRSNTTDTASVASAARTATGNSSDMTNLNAAGVTAFVNVTAASGTSPTLLVTLQGKDPISATYYTLVAQAATLTAAGSATLTAYPGASGGPASPSATSGMPVPRTWRVLWTIAGTTPSFTFSVGINYIL
jgi:hypothetical protein